MEYVETNHCRLTKFLASGVDDRKSPIIKDSFLGAMKVIESYSPAKETEQIARDS